MNCLVNHWRAVNGPRRVRVYGVTQESKIFALETRISECERRLTAAGV
jgi:hypothetical protein